MSRPRRFAVAAALVAAGATLATMVGAMPANAATSGPATPTSAPAPICFVFCVPQAWYEAASVVNNNDYIPIPGFGDSLANDTSDPAQLTDEVDTTVSATASLNGSVPLAPSAAQIASSAASIDPGVQAMVSLKLAKTGMITVQPGEEGILTFGFNYALVDGTLFERDVFGRVTSQPMQAIIPLFPTVVGFHGTTQPLVGNGPVTEVPVVTIPI